MPTITASNPGAILLEPRGNVAVFSSRMLFVKDSILY